MSEGAGEPRTSPLEHHPCLAEVLCPSNSVFTLNALAHPIVEYPVFANQPSTEGIYLLGSIMAQGCLLWTTTVWKEEEGGKIPSTNLNKEDLPYRAPEPGHAPQSNQENLEGMQTSDTI